MKRRTFIKKNAIVTLAPFITTGLLARNKKIKSLSEKPFQLNYALILECSNQWLEKI